MKKVFAVLLVGLLVFACTACADRSAFESPEDKVTSGDSFQISFEDGTVEEYTLAAEGVDGGITLKQLESVAEDLSKAMAQEHWNDNWEKSDTFLIQFLASKGMVDYHTTLGENDSSYWIYSLKSESVKKASGSYTGDKNYGIMTLSHPLGKHDNMIWVVIDK